MHGFKPPQKLYTNLAKEDCVGSLSRRVILKIANQNRQSPQKLFNIYRHDDKLFIHFGSLMRLHIGSIVVIPL